jgi:hypothetical protein
MPGVDEFVFGSEEFGRVKYPTESEAREAAEKMGIDGIHRHNKDIDDDGQKERIAMPGKNHQELNDGLLGLGLAPTPIPGKDEEQTKTGMTESRPMDRRDDLGDMGAQMDIEHDAVERDQEKFFGSPSDMVVNLGDGDDDGDMEIYK